MAELATVPTTAPSSRRARSLVTDDMVDRARAARSTTLTERFDPPTEFVVPGRERMSPRCSTSRRTVVRRAERQRSSPRRRRSLVVPYLNRLSDLLWTMARWQEGTSLPAKEEP